MSMIIADKTNTPMRMVFTLLNTYIVTLQRKTAETIFISYYDIMIS